MSFFGQWECPNCGTTWTGSIGWQMPETEEELKKMLHNMCGCSGPIEGAQTPHMSCSVMNVQISDKHKAMNLDIDKPQEKDKSMIEIGGGISISPKALEALKKSKQ